VGRELRARRDLGRRHTRAALISLSSGHVRGTLVDVVLPWAIAAVLAIAPWADSEFEGPAAQSAVSTVGVGR
jgi:hypothetical protein